ncbi:sensor histidine kinase [Streptomyces fenghuangensis]|uniref:sensor histidine kinase n=1 Tax=Streptomyces sp. ICN903 TaxID=2964654 RepID=UPI001EDBD026|nr:histidine kinase [Streptomyces sp. ICN903]MCG3040063.1 histidine kinase [Streptomyces sp. ICN903]
MEAPRPWPTLAAPAALAVAQIAWWPLGALRPGGGAPGPVEAGAGLLAVCLAAAVLGLRRRAPVGALAGVTAVAVLGPAASFPGALDVFGGAGVALALHAVAVRREAATIVIAGAAHLCWQLLWGAVLYGGSRGAAAGLVLAAVPHVVGTGTGLGRRRRLAARHAAAARLARAEAERDRAADEERHRLARELHDVGAHHLTSAVVTAEAARRLGGSRPELTAEALETAARDGRETLSTLRELVAVMRTEAEGEPHTWNGRIAELAAGVGGLGGPVETDLRADLPGGLGETVFAIVREALTNTLRHAPGAAVQVVVGHHGGLLEVTVDNGAPPSGGAPHASGAVRGLGSGRGLDGMRERAAAAGGSLTAGPRPGGGWRVRAELPADGPAPAASPAGGRGLRRPVRMLRPDRRRAAQVVLALFAVLNPLVPALTTRTVGSTPHGPAADALYLLLTAVHALPLLWRRRAPLTALAAALATVPLWPAAALSGALPPEAVPLLWVGAGVEAAALYSVAAHGRYGRGTRWAAPATGLVLGAAVGTSAAAAGLLPDRFAGPAAHLPVTVPLTAALMLVLTAAWRAGAAARTRGARAAAREREALQEAVRQAAEAVRAQRRHVAEGLRGTVLERAGRVVRSAEEGRLEDVAAEARAALAAMRELLATLHEPGGRPVGAPAAKTASGEAGPGEGVPAPPRTAAGAGGVPRPLGRGPRG